MSETISLLISARWEEDIVLKHRKSLKKRPEVEENILEVVVILCGDVHSCGK